MATSGRFDVRHSVDATEDLTGAENLFVTLGGAKAGAGERAYPLKEGAESGNGASLQVLGKSKVIAGGTFSANDELASDANAEAVAAADEDYVNAIALEDGVADDVVSVVLVSYQKNPAAA